MQGGSLCRWKINVRDGHLVHTFSKLQLEKPETENQSKFQSIGYGHH